MIRILIADDETLMCDGLETILSLQDDMEVVGIAHNGQKAYDLVASHRPDLVLMDVRMPEMDGVDSTRQIKKDFPDTVVVILTTFSEENYIIDGLVAGADGYLLKDLPAEKLLTSIRDAIRGQFILPATIAAKLAERLSFLSNPSPGPAENQFSQKEPTFTASEQKIVSLMVVGKSNREIAKTLFMSEGTVKNYVSVIYHKIGTNQRPKAILLLKEWLQNEA